MFQSHPRFVARSDVRSKGRERTVASVGLTGRQLCQPLVLSLLLLSVLCTGCGAKVYEDRLKLTRSYYDYIDRLNRNLTPQFNGQGVVLRAPRQFQVIGAPARRRGAAASEEVAEDDGGRDPRLPEHINFELPGVLSVWKAGLNTVAGGSGSSVDQNGYLYLLGNYDDWANFRKTENGADPLTFHARLIESLSLGLRIPIDPRARGSATDRVNKWYSEIVPDARDEQFVPRKEFTAINLVQPANPENGEKSPREYQLYLYQNGDMKIALVFDLPRDVSAGENLQDRILLSLQTVEVSSEKPRAPGRAAANAGGGGATVIAPAGGANSGN